MKLHWIKPFALTSLLSLTVLLPACSDDDDDDDASTGGSAGTGGAKSTGGTAGKAAAGAASGGAGTGGSAGKGGGAGKGGSAGKGGGSGAGGTAGASGAAGVDSAGSSGAGAAGASGSGGAGGAELGDIVDIAASNPDFSSLVAAVQKAELVDALKSPGPLTVFAPTNAAFDELLDELDTTLPELTKEQLQPILQYHVVSGKVEAAQVVTLTYATTLLGSDVRIKVDGGSVFLNVDTRVTATDIQASNGVIHVIDKVLLPPGDITEVAAGNDSFDSLVAALTKAELIETLQGDGPFTVFAPTDAAFATLFDDLGVTLDDLTKEQLTPILLYHVVPGKLYSEAVVAEDSLTSVEGSDISITVSGANVALGDSTAETAQVSAVDVLASNGVIHVIDKVLVP